MKKLEGRTAVITGAASGIGRGLALALARENTNLALTDINKTELNKTVEQARALGVNVFSKVFDVADRDAFLEFRDEVVDHYSGQVHIIVNNAGVSLRATVDDMEISDFEWLMNINFWGVVSGTQAFLPVLREVDEGHIVNISSVFGIIGVPTQAAYCASKFAVRGFTESLRLELLAEEARIHVSSVHPGGIKTNIVRHGRVRPMSRFDDSADLVKQFDRLAQTTPDEAAKTIIAGIKSNAPRIMIGNDSLLIDIAQRTMPSLYQQLAVRLPAIGLKLRKKQ